MTAGTWWTDWVADLPTLAFALGATSLYLRGDRRRHPRARDRRRTLAFVSGVAILVVSEASPTAAWGEVLLWPHMVQHLLITVVAAPLLAAGSPAATVRIALPPGVRRGLVWLARRSRRLRRTFGDPPTVVVSLAAHVAAIWAWHLPAAYEAAVRMPGLHFAEHVTFVGTGVWFWGEVWALVRRGHRTQGLATLCLAAMIAQGAVLGALLTFAGRPLYPGVYAGWGSLSALEDQQLAGALMWVPPGVVYAAAAVSCFAGWLAAVEADRVRRDARGRTDAPVAGGAVQD